MNASIVRILGIISGFLVLSYFSWLLSAVLLDNPTWTSFVFSSILWVLYVPMIVLGVYFYLRIHTGESLARRGRYEDAIAYALPRQEPSFWLRSHREVAHHMIAAGRAYLAMGEHERSRASLWAPELEYDRAGATRLSLSCWRMEWGLNADDLEAATRAFEEARTLNKPQKDRVWLCSLAAEVALRQDDLSRCDAMLKEAGWGADDVPAYTSFLRAQRAAAREDWREALDLLAQARQTLEAESPWRKTQLDALESSWQVSVS